MRKWLLRILAAALITALATGIAYCRAVDVPLDDDVLQYLFDECEYREVDPALVLAMCEVESGFDADAISKTNDYGLMQINAVNHKWLREHFGEAWRPLDAKDNLRAGIYVLAGYVGKYEDAHKALMAYNMGEGGARKQWRKGVYTSKYSRKIVEKMEAYTEYVESVTSFRVDVPVCDAGGSLARSD